MNIIERKQFKNHIERILHVPGNYQGGILEMAVVIDMSMSKQAATERAKELVSTLKTHSEVFRNVRLNTILWKGDEEFIKEVTPLAMLQMGRFFEDYESVPVKKNWDGLLATLKKFYARSKLIIALTENNVHDAASEEKEADVLSDEEESNTCLLIPVADKIQAKEDMQPFLHKKMLVMQYESTKKADITEVGNESAGSNKSDRIIVKSGTEIFMSLIR